MLQSAKVRKTRVLFIANPRSIHDEKWLTAPNESLERYLVTRRALFRSYAEEEEWANARGLKFLGWLEDFSIRRTFRTIRQVWKLKHFIKNNEIDLVHVLYTEPNSLWCLARNILTVPFILTTRGTDILKGQTRFATTPDPLSKLIHYLYHLSFKNASLITSTSERQAARVRELYPKVTCPVALVRTGVDMSLFSSPDNDALPSELENKQYVIFPRSMAPIYGHELAIEAVDLLAEQYKQRYHFVFLGKNCEPSYVKKISNLMAAKTAQFIFLDLLKPNALRAALRGAELAVMTPLSDGTPVTAAETMLCETPLILPNLDYDKDLFGTCYFFQNRIPGELSELIVNVLENLDRDRVSQARLNAQTKFDRKLEMEILHRGYQWILSERNSVREDKPTKDF